MIRGSVTLFNMTFESVRALRASAGERGGSPRLETGSKTDFDRARTDVFNGVSRLWMRDCKQISVFSVHLQIGIHATKTYLVAIKLRKITFLTFPSLEPSRLLRRYKFIAIGRMLRHMINQLSIRSHPMMSPGQTVCN